MRGFAPAESLLTAASSRLPFGRRRSAPGLALPALAVATLVNVPLVYLFVRAGRAGVAACLEVVFSASTARLLYETLLLVGGVVLLAVALATGTAWLVTRTDLPGRRFWAVLGALPLVFPSYVAAFAIVAVLGPRGFVQHWLQPFGVDRLPELAYGYSGALAALALYTYPYVYLPVVAALRDLDPALEQSSRSLGVGQWGSFRRVVLPQLRPAIGAGALLVGLYTLSDFGAVSIVRYNTLTLGIYNAYGALYDRNVAASLATVLVVVTLAFVLLQSRLLRRGRPTRRRPSRPHAPIPLGRWKWPALAGLAGVSLLSLGMPTGVALYWGLRAIRVGNPLGSDWLAAYNSVLVSGLAALAAVVLAIPVAAWAVRHPARLSRLAERLSYSGNALPGLVVALALVYFVTRFASPAYQTLGLLVAAYLIRFLPEAIASVHGSLAAVAPVFEEAARSLGRGPLDVLVRLTLPMIKPGLLAGAGLVFLTSMKELPATLILRPIGFETLATRIWSAADEGVYSEAALPALLLLLASLVPVYLLFVRPMVAERT